MSKFCHTFLFLVQIWKPVNLVFFTFCLIPSYVFEIHSKEKSIILRTRKIKCSAKKLFPLQLLYMWTMCQTSDKTCHRNTDEIRQDTSLYEVCKIWSSPFLPNRNHCFREKGKFEIKNSHYVRAFKSGCHNANFDPNFLYFDWLIIIFWIPIQELIHQFGCFIL